MLLQNSLCETQLLTASQCASIGQHSGGEKREQSTITQPDHTDRSETPCTKPLPNTSIALPFSKNSIPENGQMEHSWNTPSTLQLESPQTVR